MMGKSYYTRERVPRARARATPDQFETLLFHPFWTGFPGVCVDHGGGYDG